MVRRRNFCANGKLNQQFNDSKTGVRYDWTIFSIYR